MGITVISAANGPKSSVISSAIDTEQAISESDSCTSQDSSACTCRLIRPDTQPECRPASVACTVETKGTSNDSASAIAGCATSQSCACTTSGCQPSVCNRNPARVMACPMASVHAIMSGPKSNSCGSWAAAMTRTPSTVSSVVGWVLGSVPAGLRASTTTSCPPAARAVASW